MTRLCLNMIVKDEAPVVARCLESARPVIDSWAIVDTGSSDRTPELVAELLAGVPGELLRRPWRDFASNRNEALELARGHGEYVLMLDADDRLEAGARRPALTADGYALELVLPPVRYSRTQIIKAALPWQWRGVRHEFLACDGAVVEPFAGMRIRCGLDGARRRSPETYRADAAAIARELATEPEPFMRARYQFYLAQSLRDAGELEEALVAYLARAELGYWAQEVFVALIQAARLQATLNKPFGDVLATYARAANACPARCAEAMHGASRYCRSLELFRRGLELARRALPLERAP